MAYSSAQQEDNRVMQVFNEGRIHFRDDGS